MKPDKIYRLGEALHHWLSFQILCGREALLSESYLNQPTGEYLLHAAGSSHLRTEHIHPILNRQNRKGRPRQIDFCLLSRDSEQLTTAIELKWVTNASLDKQRIIDDLLRLECLLPERKGRHIYRYLIIAGRPTDLRDKFFKRSMNSGAKRIKFIDGILGTQENEIVQVSYSNLGEEQRVLFEKFGERYESPIPKKFSTVVVYANDANDVGVYCWRIQSSENRKVIEREPAENVVMTVDTHDGSFTVTPAQTNSKSPRDVEIKLTV